MNESNPLHWSFNYSHGVQNPEFAQELCKLLQEYDTKSATYGLDTEKHYIRDIYQILPNFWRGYKKSDAAKNTLSIGTVFIERHLHDDGIWNYNVRYQNTTSGEDRHFQFRCQDKCYRPLHDSWHVDVQNSCSDIYSGLKWDGYRTSDNDIRLRINGTEITAETTDNSLPLTCNWALFDVIPTLAKKIKESGDNIDIVLLDDLEQLRPKNKIGFFDSIQSPIPLDGYYLYGSGMLPSYWWVDANGNIALVSSVFETLVVKEKTGTSS